MRLKLYIKKQGQSQLMIDVDFELWYQRYYIGFIVGDINFHLEPAHKLF